MTMRPLLAWLLAACGAWLPPAFGQNSAAARPVRLYIFGCNGDLAQRHLWPALRRLDERANQSAGAAQLHCVLRGDTSDQQLLPAAQPELRQWFLRTVRLHRGVGAASGYRSFCEAANSLLPTPGLRRIFYLAIPPKAYADTLHLLASLCRHPRVLDEFVLEKPFGSSERSAQLLMRHMRHQCGIADNRVYRVDHYLGKHMLAHLLHFRQANPELESQLNSAHVLSIEATISETMDVAGRVKFYDSEGVIRDVMQNHLTEMLALGMMELPASISGASVAEAKRRVLSEFCPALHDGLLVGQYAGYAEQLGRDSRTPTFAAAGLRHCSQRWQSVPVLATAGKRLRAKASYLRLLLADSVGDSGDASELLVYVGGDAAATGLPRPLIACSPRLRCRPPHQLRLLPANALPANATSPLLRRPLRHYDLFHLRPGHPDSRHRAYEVVLTQLLLQATETFVQPATLLAAWRLWDSVLALTPQLAVYSQPPRFSANRRSQLSWLDARLGETEASDSLPLLRSLRHSYAGVSRLSWQLARRIEAAALAKVRRGEEFHLALPGGESAQSLMQHLALGTAVAWGSGLLHVWLVDERCVADANASNALVLDRNLLRLLPRPSLPRRCLRLPLLATDCRRVAKEFAAEVASVQHFDFVVLGVGGDGHVASLFPGADGEGEGDDSASPVVVAEQPGADAESPIRWRVSMSAGVLSNASEVALLLIGAGKQAALQQLLASVGTEPAPRQEAPFLRILRLAAARASLWIDSSLAAH